MPRLTTLRRFAAALLLVAASVAAGVRCTAARETLMTVTPGVPDREPGGCDAGAWRCSGPLPQQCSASGRWWIALPRAADGRQTTCVAGCAYDDAGTAYCLGAEDGGAR